MSAQTKHTHTPGPWGVTEYTDTDGENVIAVGIPDLRGTSGRDYSMRFSGMHVAKVYHGDMANARLIASAPDLLAACENLLRAYDTSDDDAAHEWWAERAEDSAAEWDRADYPHTADQWREAMRERARAAIAKARGEQGAS